MKTSTLVILGVVAFLVWLLLSFSEAYTSETIGRIEAARAKEAGLLQSATAH